ncbi:hypothetical protein EVG20_g4621, partial [Dentipellis fragilis]
YAEACVALVLLPGVEEIMEIELAGLPEKVAQRLQVDLRKIVKAHGRNARAGDIKAILLKLWTSVVKPALDALAYPVIDGSTPRPRITWSSYTPTLSALRSDVSDANTSFHGLLAVSQPSTPNQKALPNTTAEIEKIRSYVSAEHVEWLNDTSATISRVQEEMSKRSWLHLACHAVQDAKDPLKSALCLYDGRLELANIIRKSHPYAEFAFLSACQTSSGDEKLAEEASIKDQDAPDNAEAVYREVGKGGRLDARGAAEALFWAVEALRKDGLRKETRPATMSDEWFLSWVPFIHIGIAILTNHLRDPELRSNIAPYMIAPDYKLHSGSRSEIARLPQSDTLLLLGTPTTHKATPLPNPSAALASLPCAPPRHARSSTMAASHDTARTQS